MSTVIFDLTGIPSETITVRVAIRPTMVLMHRDAPTVTWTATATNCTLPSIVREIVAAAPPAPRPSLSESKPYLGAPRDLSWFARLSQGLTPPPRLSPGVPSRWRPLPVRLVPRVVRRQSRVQ